MEASVATAPAVQAALVERVAWRLDALLPAQGAYSSAAPQIEPARQRGVQVGSVVKMRRHHAPPVVLAVGVRRCTGVVSVLDVKGSESLWSARIPDSCGRLRLLPPTDLDGDGALETAVFDETQVTVLRVVDSGRDPDVEVLGHWRCPELEG
jgi:hypothetical protein